jgi:glycerol-3-phosphate dehydrogenase
VERVVHQGGAVRGVVTTDVLGGGTVEIRGRAVVVAAGPWAPALTDGDRSGLPQAFALNLEVGRRLAEAAVGVRAPTGPGDDPIIGGRRFIFLVPQVDSTLLGTWYAPSDGREAGALLEQGAAALLAEVGAACPALELTADDVVRLQWGWLPLKAGREPGRPNALADRPRVIDHGERGGVRGMFSVEGVKYTTARRVAEQVVDRLMTGLGIAAPRCLTAEVRVDHGTDAAGDALGVRVRRAVRDERAVRLSDIVLRRITPGLAPSATRETVAAVARIAAAELGWAAAREEAEIVDVMRQLRPLGSTVEPVA